MRIPVSRDRAALLVLAASVLACSDDSARSADDAGSSSASAADDAGSTTDPDATTGSEPADSTGGVASGPTYYQDIAPVISERCSGCHTPGGAAPLVFSDYEATAPLAPLIASQLMSGAMPPWPPGGETPPLQHDRSLTDDQLELMLAWAEAGAPEGDASNPAPLVPPEVIELPSHDVATDIGTDYVADASISDDYHCFMIELGTTQDHVATGYQFIPQNTKTVHHVLSTVFTAESIAAIQAVDDETPEVGWPCFGGYSNIPGGDPVGALGGWVPGVTASNYPAGTGTMIPAGAVVVAQIHYNTLGGTDPDRTRLDLAFAPAEQEDELVLLHTSGMPWPGFMIPAGDADYSTEKEARVSVLLNAGLAADDTGYVMGFAGHMHKLGVEIELSLVAEDGSESTLLHIPKWDFGWQGAYSLVEPIRVVGTDRIKLRCVYDNSDEHRAAQQMGPTEDVTWGEGTADEMCLGYLQVVDVLPGG
jgi:mono/diheme cytochrome c family protein